MKHTHTHTHTNERAHTHGQTKGPMDGRTKPLIVLRVHNWNCYGVWNQSSYNSKGVFLVKDNGVSNGLATFVHSHRSLWWLPSQRSASLCLLHSLAPFTGLLTHFAHSLVRQLKFLKMCSRCDRVLQEQTCFTSSLETRPELIELSGMYTFLILFFSLSQIWIGLFRYAWRLLCYPL